LTCVVVLKTLWHYRASVWFNYNHEYGTCTEHCKWYRKSKIQL